MPNLGAGVASLLVAAVGTTDVCSLLLLLILAQPRKILRNSVHFFNVDNKAEIILQMQWENRLEDIWLNTILHPYGVEYNSCNYPRIMHSLSSFMGLK